MDRLGAKFWLGLIGAAIAIGLAAGLTLMLIGAVWYAWGLFGVFLAILLVFGGIGYVMDRRERTRRESLAG
jgi:membrane protein implicated in regulation of membrane protease activity